MAIIDSKVTKAYYSWKRQQFIVYLSSFSYKTIRKSTYEVKGSLTCSHLRSQKVLTISGDKRHRSTYALSYTPLTDHYGILVTATNSPYRVILPHVASFSQSNFQMNRMKGSNRCVKMTG